jgi:LPXTG-motif cell wall-anchored protein
MSSSIRLPRLSRKQWAAIVGGGLAIGLVGGATFPGVASATDASATATKACVSPSDSLWKLSVTFVNQWDGDTTVTFDANTAAYHVSRTLHGNGDTWTPTPITTSDSAVVVMVSSDHPDHFHDNASGTYTTPTGCTPSGTTVAPTTPPTTTCANAIPVRADCGPTAPSSPGTTVAVPTTAAPPETTTTEKVPVAIVRSGPPKTPQAPVVSKPAALPATGSNDTIAVVAGLGALLVGGILLLAGRRQSTR